MNQFTPHPQENGASAHTPGPWALTGSIVYAADHAICQIGHAFKNREANARLIEAAPELLEALEKAAPFVGWASTRGQIVAGVDAAELCDTIDALIAKARGQ